MSKHIFLVLLCLLIFLSCASKLKHQLLPTQDKHNVVQANHFSSDKQITATYIIQKVEKGLSLILILRPKDEETKQTQKINFKLTSGSKSVQCEFSNFSSVCVLDQVQNPQMTMDLKCTKLPCDASWTIYQAQLKKPVGLNKLRQLYQLPANNKHSIVILTCNNPQIKNYDKKINIYTDANYIKTHTNGVIFYLFDNNPKKSYMYFRVKQQQVKLCTMMGIYTSPQTLKNLTQVKDFVTSTQKNIFKLKGVEQKVFRIDASMHEAHKKMIATSTIQISLIASKKGQRQVLSKSNITPFSKKKIFDFSYVFSSVSSDYQDVQLQMISQDKTILINFQLVISPKIQVQIGEISYFNLKKNQKITYFIPSDPQQNEKTIGYIKPYDETKLKISPSSCLVADGCEFTVQALQNIGTGYIAISDNSAFTPEKVLQEINYIDIINRQQRRISEEDTIYFKRTLQAKKSYQVIVNSANVIMYAASKEKCQNPGKHCYEKVGNNLHPFIYEPEIQIQLRIAVIGLDTCWFTLMIIEEDSQFIQLVDGIGFQYELDDEQDSVAFTFSLTQIKDVAFNLISPLHSLELYVQNSKQKPKVDETDYKSLDGFISFSKSQIKGKTFTILVKKTKQMENSFVHFTLIPTTKGTNVRLQPGITHYQTMQPDSMKKLVFQFNIDESAALNIYTHNTKGLAQLNLQMDISKSDLQWEEDKIESYTIDRSQDILQLSSISKQLCENKQAKQCEIFLKITNNMQQQVDISFTLVVSHSIIQLTDGLWSNFVVSQTTSSSHFYYVPKKQDKSINIMYKSSYDSLRVSYKIWKAQDQNINPSQWPFPASIIKETDKENYNFKVRPVKHLTIHKDVLSKCWPSCVILISLVQLQQKLPVQVSKFNQMHLQDYFSIMLTNSYIQIPQQDKIDIILQNAETKFLLIDIKDFLGKDKQSLTFFTSTLIGDVDIYGSVYSENNPRCPTLQQSDFSFGRLQTQVKKQTIKKALKDNKMTQDNNVYLCLAATGISETKFYIQWTSQQNYIKFLDANSYQTVTLAAGDSKIFQFTPRTQDFKIKILRNRGFPFLKISNCDGTGAQTFEKCLEKIQKNDKQNNKQMLTKTQMYTQKQCEDCIIFIRISAQEPAQITMHLQENSNEVDLQQNKIFTDFIQEQQVNKYVVMYIPSKTAIISVNIQSGDAIVQITDYKKVNIKKTKSANSNIIRCIIPPITDNKLLNEGQEMLGAAFFQSSVQASLLRSLHIAVTAKDPKVSTSYTITYSLGKEEVYLQDGLVLNYMLQPQKEIVFYYENALEKGKIFITITANNAEALNSLKIQMHNFLNPQDQETMVQFTPQKPPIRRKSINPSILFSLPGNLKLYRFTFQNTQQGQQLQISLLINHAEVILLPYNFQFLFQLEQGETINLLTDILMQGYLNVKIKKCDESSPTFSYTLDEKSFQKLQFDFQSDLTDDPVFQYSIKTSKYGTFFMNFKSQQSQKTAMIVKVNFSNQKVKASKIKPGNKGQLQYQLLSSSVAEISFKGLQCSDKKCNKNITYFTISGPKKIDLYAQAVCPAASFVTSTRSSVALLAQTQISQKGNTQDQIKFQYKLQEHISYVGVKAVTNQGEQYYYRPIQIVTIWGQLSRTSQMLKFTILIIFICVILLLMAWVRRNARKGYIPLQQSRD